MPDQTPNDPLVEKDQIRSIWQAYDRGSAAGLQRAQAEVRRHLDLVEGAL